MRIRTILGTAVGALAVAAGPASATVAQAADQGGVEPAAAETCRSNHAGASVCFDPDGDHFYLKDTAADGYSAAVQWETSYGRSEVCVNVHGAGSTVDCNYNMREDYTVTFWAVNVDTPTNTYAYWSDEQSAII